MSDTVTSSPLATIPRPRNRHAIHVVHPLPRSIALVPGTITFGREGADLAFPSDRALSRIHCELRLDAGQLHVRDLGSHNGTWKNGARVEQSVVSDGDFLRLGDTFLLYRVEPAELVDAILPRFIGDSPPIRHLRARLVELAPTRATVVLLGETGTGKSLAARALHDAAGRRGEFIHVNCAAIPESVAESTLFGHKAGAFTDARSDSPGLFRAAHRGTLFLDEVALLSPASQARLLVVLETGNVTPVGATTPVAVDVRLIAATNEDLSAAVGARTFRGDLHARLSDVTVSLPPLRSRREDVLPLLRAALGPNGPVPTADAVDLLLRWHWPYNVREVEKLAIELSTRCDGLTTIDARALGERFLSPGPVAATAEGPPSIEPPPDTDALVALLKEVDGNVAELARRVGRSTKQIYRWCARHGLDPAKYRA